MQNTAKKMLQEYATVGQMCGYKPITFYIMKGDMLKVQADNSFCDMKY